MGVMKSIGLKGHGETCSGTGSLLYPQTLGPCLVQGRYSVGICWMQMSAPKQNMTFLDSVELKFNTVPVIGICSHICILIVRWPAHRDWYCEFFINRNFLWPLLDFSSPSCLKGQEMRVRYASLAAHVINV